MKGLVPLYNNHIDTSPWQHSCWRDCWQSDQTEHGCTLPCCPAFSPPGSLAWCARAPSLGLDPGPPPRLLQRLQRVRQGSRLLELQKERNEGFIGEKVRWDQSSPWDYYEVNNVQRHTFRCFSERVMVGVVLADVKISLLLSSDHQTLILSARRAEVTGVEVVEHWHWHRVTHSVREDISCYEE